ncbi:endonuclease V [Thermocladium modestius]|uniref:Endonuclease V n=1 Tax=Thermocladium modestius TaxID=62609 RepID=A0A830GZH1_9CREN|nr:endonuclease V [Thermocladium modestius]GGP22288.1 endonuclease V [Thermocladium modestius]
MRIVRTINENYVKSRVPRGFNLSAARAVQRRLSGLVVEKPLSERRLVAGLDVAYVGNTAVAAAVIVDSISKAVMDSAVIYTRVDFPYIPTLLSFRELKPMVMAYKSLERAPHVVMIDGHGIAHPYRLGIAAHFGVTMGMPTIGVAKSLLYGECDVDVDASPILDPATGDQLGAVIRCGAGLGPTFISVGNLISLPDAVRLARELCVSSVMPLPILMAHRLANKAKKSIKPQSG